MSNSSVENPVAKPPLYKTSKKLKTNVKLLNGDKYRESNTNNVSFLFTQGFSQKSCQWNVGLRSYHPDKNEAFSSMNNKFHVSNLKLKEQVAQNQPSPNK